MSEAGKAVVRQVRAVRDGHERALIFVEGVRLVEEIPGSVPIELVVYSPKLLRSDRGAALLKKLTRRSARCVELSEGQLEKLGDTTTPQGIIVLARRPATSAQLLEQRRQTAPLVVILHRMNNPANAGAMLRVAEAAGATGVIATTGTTDLFSPKALRGSMGSGFRLPIWDEVRFEQALAWCRVQQIQTVSTHLNATLSHCEIDWRVPRAVIVGEESAGLDEAESQAADHQIRIPMQPPVESLNAAVALGIVLYEALRQRTMP